MKVLHLSHRFHPCTGGVERHIKELSKKLIERGHECSVLCLNRCDKGMLLKREEVHDEVKVHRTDYLDLGLYKVAPFPLKLLKDYDLLHVHGLGFFSDFLALTSHIHKKPMVLTTHGGIFHTKRLAIAKKLYFKLWARAVLRRFDKIIAVSRSDENHFSKISSRVVVIPNGVDVDALGEIKRKGKEPNFLFVGRISRNKRVDRLIETIAVMKEKAPEVRLSIVGPDWEGLQRSLENLAEGRGVTENVTFAGEVGREDLLKHFEDNAFFVSASEYEGFGISVIEAMAAGMVVIVNDIAAFREIIEDGKTGFIVDYAKTEEAAGRILEIFEIELEGIMEAAGRKAKKYDWGAIAEKVEDVYKEAIGGES